MRVSEWVRRPYRSLGPRRRGKCECGCRGRGEEMFSLTHQSVGSVSLQRRNPAQTSSQSRGSACYRSPPFDRTGGETERGRKSTACTSIGAFSEDRRLQTLAAALILWRALQELRKTRRSDSVGLLSFIFSFTSLLHRQRFSISWWKTTPDHDGAALASSLMASCFAYQNLSVPFAKFGLITWTLQCYTWFMKTEFAFCSFRSRQWQLQHSCKNTASYFWGCHNGKFLTNPMCHNTSKGKGSLVKRQNLFFSLSHQGGPDPVSWTFKAFTPSNRDEEMFLSFNWQKPQAEPVHV